MALARAAHAEATITLVVPKGRTDGGGTHCRLSAAAWNEQLRLGAHERLAEAGPAHRRTADGPIRRSVRSDTMRPDSWLVA